MRERRSYCRVPVTGGTDYTAGEERRQSRHLNSGVGCFLFRFVSFLSSRKRKIVHKKKHKQEGRG